MCVHPRELPPQAPLLWVDVSPFKIPGFLLLNDSRWFCERAIRGNTDHIYPHLLWLVRGRIWEEKWHAQKRKEILLHFGCGIYISGCFVEQLVGWLDEHEYRENLRTRFTRVDAYFGLVDYIYVCKKHMADPDIPYGSHTASDTYITMLILKKKKMVCHPNWVQISSEKFFY